MRKDKMLRPCPFCGNPNVRIITYKADGKRYCTDRKAVLCDYRDDGCGSESGHWKSVEEAVYMWNQRRRKWRE